MTYATTFSGIGCWELGLDACGWELRWQCERDSKLREFLKDNFGKPVYSDIKTIYQENPEPVDVLVASQPCQPFSTGGRMRAKKDDRYLWPEVFELIKLIQPPWFIGENVAHFCKLALDDVLSDLESQNYATRPFIIPACALNAADRRDRVWFIAHNPGFRRNIRASNRQGRPIQENLIGNTAPLYTDRPELQFIPWENGPSDSWKRFVSLCGGMDDRRSDWIHRIKALGNALRPQIPFMIGQTINQVCTP